MFSFIENLFLFTGINRFFHMACIHKNFLAASGKTEIASSDLWKHLSDMYNLDTLVYILERFFSA